MKITSDHRADVANKRGKLTHSDNGTAYYINYKFCIYNLHIWISEFWQFIGLCLKPPLLCTLQFEVLYNFNKS